MDDNVKNAFNCVSRMYEETSFLLKDFTEIMAKHDFASMIKGNAIGTNVSKHIEYPRCWLPRYIALFYESVSQIQSKSDPLLSITTCFCDPEYKAVEPSLVLGVVKGLKSKKDYEYWWLYSSFFNDSDAFEYYNHETKERLELPWEINNEPISFKCRNNKLKYLPKEGIFFHKKLLSIKNYKDIELLADRIVELWHKFIC